MLKRSFILGEDWAYLKIYTGVSTADILLPAQIFTLTKSLEFENIIEKWFFLRYQDEKGFHIRIRFYLANKENLPKLISKICFMLQPLIDDNTIHSVVYDTYLREVERYGERVYPLTEEMFHIDSSCAIECLYIIRKLLPSNENLRWMCSLAMINDTLDSAQINLISKNEIIIQNRDAFRREFGVNSSEQTRIFDRKYRENRRRINDAITYTGFPQELIDVLNKRKKALLALTNNWEEINISSVLHMTCNRMFVTANRLCELTLYEYLSKYYQSEIAKIKYCK